jgi:hypothetical protein
LLNIQSVFRETLKALSKNEALKGKVNVEQLRDDLILETDNILGNILTNLADHYPQAPASGGTSRMREAINEVNRVDDEKNDFIYTSGIKISDFLLIGTDEKGK